MSSYLIKKSKIEDIINQTQYENLSLITSGPIPPNPIELLNLERMKDLIKILKEKYEYIIIDTRYGLVTDSVITMKLSDINLYVVRHNYTKKNMLNIINDLFETNQVSNLKIIINDYVVKPHHMGQAMDIVMEMDMDIMNKNKRPLDCIQDLIFGEYGGVNPSISDSLFLHTYRDSMGEVFDGVREGCYLYSRHTNPSNFI